MASNNISHLCREKGKIFQVKIHLDFYSKYFLIHLENGLLCEKAGKGGSCCDTTRGDENSLEKVWSKWPMRCNAWHLREKSKSDQDPNKLKRPGRFCSLIEKTKAGQCPEQVSNHQKAGCLAEPCIALHHGLGGNKSQEKMGHRVHVEQPRV